ncbi:hypothetical protein KA005_01110, partial [bacterium]|nr:hypothetical protein [bacterium]
MKKFLIIQVCLLFVHIQVFSAIEKYNFHHLNVNNGLSTSDVWAIHKDSKGYMWFGTDYGLNRYNGIDFHTYYSIPGDSNSISFNIITSISEDSTGHIWVGTKYGLSVFRPELNSFKRYFHEPGKHSSLGNNKIKLIFTDSRSNIWISHGTGLDLYNPEEDNFIPITDLARNDKVSIPRGVYSMTEDMNGDLWLGSNTIYRLDIQDNMLIEYDLDIENVGVIYLHYTEKNILWAATSNGNVFYYNMVRDAFEILDPTRYKIDHFVNILGEDFYGNLLIGTDGGGLYLLENTTSGLTRIQHDPDDESSISNNTIAAIYTDKEGIFWLGNWRGGVNYANKFSEGFKLIRHRINDNNSLIHNNVRTIYEDSSGDLWYGTSDGFSWWEKDKNRINNFSTENSANLASNFITCFYEADNQTI